MGETGIRRRVATYLLGILPLVLATSCAQTDVQGRWKNPVASPAVAGGGQRADSQAIARFPLPSPNDVNAPRLAPQLPARQPQQPVEIAATAPHTAKQAQVQNAAQAAYVAKPAESPRSEVVNAIGSSQGEVIHAVIPAPVPDNVGAQPADSDPTIPLPMPPGDEAVDLAQLEQWALENNPTLAQLAAAVDKARGIQRQSGLYPNPEMGYSAQEVGNNGAAGQQGAYLYQTVVTGGKLRLNRAVAGQDVNRLSWEWQAQKQRVLNEVQLRYYDVVAAEQRLQVAAELKTIAESGVKATRQLYDAKHAAKPDILQGEVQRNEVEILHANAELDHQAAWKQLTNVIGRPDLQMMTVHGTLDGPDPQFDWENTYQRLLEASPELQAARAAYQRAQLNVQRQRAQPIPNVMTQWGAARDDSTGDGVGYIQVGIPVPLFNRNQGGIDAAYSETQRAAHEVTRVELSLRNRLAETFARYQKARAQVDRYRTQILPLAQESLELIDEGYRYGEFDVIRVLTVRRAYFESKLSFVQSLVELRRAEVEINGLLLTGALNPTADVAEAPLSVEQ